MSSSGPAQPGRYNRSVNGLIGSMLVIVVVVVAFVLVRKIVSAPLDVTNPPIEYLGLIEGLQQSDGEFPPYPASLPEGWSAYNLTPPTSSDGYRLDLHTAEQHYVAVAETKDDAQTLLHKYVDADPISGAALSTPGGLAPTWAGWTDSGGDSAFTATVGDDTVIVFGAAPEADVETVVKALTVAPVPKGVPTTAATGATSPTSPTSPASSTGPASPTP